MNVFLLFSILLVVLYVGTTIWRSRELPESISAMVYYLPRDGKWAWSAWMCCVSAMLFEPMVVATEFLGWLTCICLMGAALTPLINTETRVWHNALGIAAGVLSQVCVAVVCPWWLLAWIVMLVLIGGAFCGFNDSDGRYGLLDGKGVFVAEIICYVSLVGSLLTV